MLEWSSAAVSERPSAWVGGSGVHVNPNDVLKERSTLLSMLLLSKASHLDGHAKETLPAN